jgi:aldose 1-epimerase
VPNRLADGRYLFDGEHFQVALTEPEKHNDPRVHALAPWRMSDRDSAAW